MKNIYFYVLKKYTARAFLQNVTGRVLEFLISNTS